MSKYVTDEAMRSAMTLQKGYIDKGDNTNAEGIDSIKKGKNLLTGVITGTDWGSSVEAVYNTILHEIDVTDGVFSIKEAGDNYIVSSFVNVEEGKTYTFSFYYINGGVYEIHIIGETNNHVLTASGGGPISGSFTSVATEAVRIFIKTDDKKLKNPQLEWGSKVSQFVASTEELKDYIDKGDKANAEGIESIEDRMEEVVQTQLITTPPATLNAQVGYYYCMGGSGVVVDTMTIQLPAIADENKTKNVQFFMTMGSAPEVTFVSAGTERILYQKDFALEAERSYEVNALWNGHAWVITVVEIIVPFFAKLSLNNGEVVELQGSGALTDTMILPYKASVVSAEIGTLCTSIGNSAFYMCTGLTSVTIGNGVTSIGNSAFSSCSGLTSITSLATTAPTIKSSTFNNIKTGGTLTVPSGSSGYNVWMGTGDYYLGKYGWTMVPMNIITYEATAKLTETTGQTSSGLHTNAFSGKNGQLTMTSHTFENGIGTIEFDGDVTSIGSYAFNYCSGLTSLTIPDSVTSIGNNAIKGCTNLTSLTIPDSVTSIGNNAISGCSGLTSIVVDSGNTVYDSRDNCNAIINTSTNELIAGCMNTVIPNTVTSIGYAAFSNCTGLTNITIPDSVTSIGEYVFFNCTGLTSITIPDSVTTIGKLAFGSCSVLTSVIIPNSVTSIGQSAFQQSALTSITIPDSVTSIGEQAFSYCKGLTSITSLAATAPTIQNNTFGDIKTNGTLTVPSGSTGYDVWMGTGDYYLGKYNWTKVEQ